MMVIEVREDKLQIDCTERTWRFTFFLEYVSGEPFFVKKTGLYSKETDTGTARFRIGVDSTVRSFGVDLIDGIEDEDELDWFEREDSS